MVGAALIFGAASFLLPVSGVYAEDKVVAGISKQSVLRTAWRAILDETGLPIELKTLQAKDRRLQFVEGRIDLDCCSIPEWRTKPEEMAVQLYTEPFFVSAQFFIYHETMPFHYKTPADLKSKTIAVIRGHDHLHQEYFGDKVLVDDFRELFEAVSDGRADIAIVNEQEFKFQMSQYDFPVAQGDVFHRLAARARVHKSRADLLPKLNGAIKKLKSSGEINMLIGREMRKRMYQSKP